MTEFQAQQVTATISELVRAIILHTHAQGLLAGSPAASASANKVKETEQDLEAVLRNL